MRINEKEMLKMLRRNMLDSMNLYSQRYEYINNTPVEKILADLKAKGISIDEMEVVEQYKKIRSIEALDEYYYEKYEMLWDSIERQYTLINSDVQLECIVKIIKKHFDYNNLPDSWFIQDRMQYIEDKCPKAKVQDEVMAVISLIIECAKIKNTRFIDDIVDCYDCDEYFRFHIKKCHNRDHKFKALMKAFYDAFDDIDQTIYKIK